MSLERQAEAKDKLPERDSAAAEDAAVEPSFSAGLDKGKELREPSPNTTAHMLRRTSLLQMQRQLGNASVQRLLASKAAQRETPPGDAAETGGLIVEEEVASLGPGQMRKSAFLAELRASVETTVQAELAGSPLLGPAQQEIARQVAQYAELDGPALEQAIRREVPDTSQAASAQAYIPLVCERVRATIAAQRAGMPLGAEALAGAASSVASAASGLADAIGNVFLKPAAGATPAAADPHAIRAQLGHGQELPGGVRADMEGAFGESFGGVRLHTDPGAAGIASSLGARAFAVGEHVAFGGGQYQPGTPIGDALLAHELAHVVQQRGARVAAPMQKGSGEYGALESDADTAAVGAVASLWGGVRGALGKLANQALPQLKSALRLQMSSCSGGQDPTRMPGMVLGHAPNRTDEVFQPGDVPGERPTARIMHGGFDEFRFDGDGDQMKELIGRTRTTVTRSDGSVARIRLDLTQVSTGVTKGAEFTLPDTQGTTGPDFTIIEDVTDGRRPTVISLITPIGQQELRVHPPDRSQPVSTPNVTYRAELVSHAPSPHPSTAPATTSQSTDLAFQRDAAPTRRVFQADQPTQVGGIWSVDLTAGAYGDRFRLTFQKPNPAANATIGGISVLSDGAPIAGRRLDLAVAGALNVQIVQNDGISLALDLNGDGRSDIEFFDRMVEPAEYDGGGPPVRNRNHDLLAVGPAASGEINEDYAVRDGLITAGSTTPRAEDMAAASNASAVTGLQDQQQIGAPGLTRPEERGTLRGELDSVEQLLSRARGQARTDNIISQAVFDAWDVIERDFIQLAPQIQAHSVQATVQAQAAAHALAFHDALAGETRAGERTQGAMGTYVATNEYTGLGTADPALGPNPGERLAAAIRTGNWSEATQRYRRLVNGLDRWIARTYRERYGSPDANRPETNRANQVEYLTTLREELHGLKARNAVRVAAVFHPEEQFMESGRITEVPLSLYYTLEDGTWYLQDRTRPSETWHSSGLAAQPGHQVPPAELFSQLDEGAHFPRGTVHYQVRGGAGGQVPTTGPHPIREWLTWIGIAGAAIGLGLVTFGTGTVAVVGTVALAASAASGGTLAGIDLVERLQHGTGTVETVTLDLAQIVAAVAGVGAIGAGRLVFSARAAAAGSAPRTGARWALLLRWADEARVPLALTSGGADVVQMAMLAPDIARQYDAIDNAPGDDESRRRARIILLTQAAVSAGLMALSLRGNAAEITRGRSLEVINVNGEPVVVPRGESIAGKRVNQSRRDLAAGDPATAGAREQAHLEQIRGRVEGPGGQALADVEQIALRQARGAPEGALSADAAGNIMQGGQQNGQTIRQLTERVDMANNASRAHGIETEYVLQFRPGATPNTTEVRVVAQPRGRGAIANTAPLYRNVPGRAQAEAGQIERLLRHDPASRIELTPEGMVRINGQIEIHPSRLEQIADVDPRPARIDGVPAPVHADAPNLLRATRELEAVGGDYNQLRPEMQRVLDRLVASGTYRLRFAHTRQEARLFLAGQLHTLGIDINTDPRCRIFQNATDADLDRLFDLANAEGPGAAPRLPSRATDYALSRNPGTIREFVEHYEFYEAYYSELARVRAGPGATRGPRNQARAAIEAEMADPADANRASTQAQADVAARYEVLRAQIRGRVGGAQIRPRLSTAETVAELQRLPRDQMSFTSESASVYHAEKHFNQLPDAVRRTVREGRIDQMTAYLDAAADTIRTASATEAAASMRYAQNGSGRSFTFGGAGARAIVFVSSEGRVILLTYP